MIVLGAPPAKMISVPDPPAIPLVRSHYRDVIGVYSNLALVRGRAPNPRGHALLSIVVLPPSKLAEALQISEKRLGVLLHNAGAFCGASSRIPDASARILQVE